MSGDGGGWTPYAQAQAEQAARADVANGDVGVHRWDLRRDPAPVEPHGLDSSWTLLRCETPPVAYYRFLYDTVGTQWHWMERRRMSDDALAELLAGPSVELRTLFIDGAPQGFFELEHDARTVDGDETPAVELKYFGLMPWATGRGVGPKLLRAAQAAAQADRRTMVVHTCSLDHPGALPTYQRAGFRIVAECAFTEKDPRPEGLAPRTANPHAPIRE